MTLIRFNCYTGRFTCNVYTSTDPSAGIRNAYTALSRSWSIAGLPAELPRQTAEPALCMRACAVGAEHGPNDNKSQSTTQSASQRRYACVTAQLRLLNRARSTKRCSTGGHRGRTWPARHTFVCLCVSRRLPLAPLSAFMSCALLSAFVIENCHKLFCNLYFAVGLKGGGF